MTGQPLAPSPDTEVDVGFISDEEFEDRLFPSEQRRFSGWTRRLVTLAGVALSLLTLYFAFTSTIGEIANRSLFLLFAIPLSLLLYPALKRSGVQSPTVVDWILAGGGALAFGWAFVSQDRWLNRYVGFDDIPTFDIVLGVIALIVTLEATRRTVGAVIVSLNLVVQL